MMNQVMFSPGISITNKSQSPLRFPISRRRKYGSFNQAVGVRMAATTKKGEETHIEKKKRVFFLDVNPLCYDGSTPSLHSFAHWISLFFSQVSHNHPVIAVIDGERGNEYRRLLLPSYKAHRSHFSSRTQHPSKGSISRSHHIITDVLNKCNVPVVKVEDHEADDVVATLVGEVLERGYLGVIASPDKDFKQLVSENVQIVMPMPEFDRWSFYTLKHYMAQNNIDPRSDLSLRCMLGDEVDGVPGIQHMAPGFGRKTAIKLLQKHGSLENLLNAAAVRTVGKQYAQDALIKYADYLRRNYQVLALKRDVNVHLQEEWLLERDSHNDSAVLSGLLKLLGESRKINRQSKWHSPSVEGLKLEYSSSQLMMQKHEEDEEVNNSMSRSVPSSNTAIDHRRSRCSAYDEEEISKKEVARSVMKVTLDDAQISKLKNVLGGTN